MIYLLLGVLAGYAGARLLYHPDGETPVADRATPGGTRSDRTPMSRGQRVTFVVLLSLFAATLALFADVLETSWKHQEISRGFWRIELQVFLLGALSAGGGRFWFEAFYSNRTSLKSALYGRYTAAVHAVVDASFFSLIAVMFAVGLLLALNPQWIKGVSAVRTAIVEIDFSAADRVRASQVDLSVDRDDSAQLTLLIAEQLVGAMDSDISLDEMLMRNETVRTAWGERDPAVVQHRVHAYKIVRGVLVQRISPVLTCTRAALDARVARTALYPSRRQVAHRLERLLLTLTPSDSRASALSPAQLVAARVDARLFEKSLEAHNSYIRSILSDNERTSCPKPYEIGADGFDATFSSAWTDDELLALRRVPHLYLLFGLMYMSTGEFTHAYEGMKKHERYLLTDRNFQQYLGVASYYSERPSDETLKYLDRSLVSLNDSLDKLEAASRTSCSQDAACKAWIDNQVRRFERGKQFFGRQYAYVASQAGIGKARALRLARLWFDTQRDGRYAADAYLILGYAKLSFAARATPVDANGLDDAEVLFTEGLEIAKRRLDGSSPEDGNSDRIRLEYLLELVKRIRSTL